MAYFVRSRSETPRVSALLSDIANHDLDLHY